MGFLQKISLAALCGKWRRFVKMIVLLMTIICADVMLLGCGAANTDSDYLGGSGYPSPTQGTYANFSTSSLVLDVGSRTSLSFSVFGNGTPNSSSYLVYFALTDAQGNYLGKQSGLALTTSQESQLTSGCLIGSNSTNSFCSVIVTATESATPGNYLITPLSDSGITNMPQPIPLVVESAESGGSDPGYFSIAPNATTLSSASLANSGILAGIYYVYYITITLNNSENIASVVPTIRSTQSTITQYSCDKLSTSSPACVVSVQPSNTTTSGSLAIIVSAPGYNGVTATYDITPNRL